MKKLSILIFVLSLLISNVFAETIEFEFEGYVDVLEENTDDGMFYMGQQFQGSFSYCLIPDLDLGAVSYSGAYHQNASLSVMLDTANINYSDSWVFIRVYNGFPNGEDSFSFGVDAQYEEYNFTKFGIELTDSTGAVFNSDALPTSLDLSAFDSVRFCFAGYKNGFSDWFHAEAQITKLTLIPEPCSVVLLGLGSIALLRRRR